MSENTTLNTCSDCRHWKENLPVQLCQFGKCYLTDHPVEKERTDCCENFTAIEAELEE